MNNKKILISGKGGQLANALKTLLGDQALMFGQEDADFLNPDFIMKMERHIVGQPLSAVINAAAYTQVDATETTGREQAFRINGTAVGELAVWCKKNKLPLIHYSSDYVFDGSGHTPWHENDPPRPLNAYGQSKLAGERLLAEHGGDHLLFRTSWLYDATGKNFYTTMRRLMNEKESLNVVADQIGAPTYVPHLATATLAALNNASSGKIFESGLYHLCSSGTISWHGFASAIFEHERTINPGLKCKSVNPIASSAYPLPAPRPLNSRLDCSRVRDILGITMPDWEVGLRECFSAYADFTRNNGGSCS